MRRLYINSIITMAMMFELFPAEFMGRWMGINRFFRMTLAAVSAYAAGFIWNTIGPPYLFIAFIGIDLLIRIPLLISVAETKGMKHSQKVS